MKNHFFTMTGDQTEILLATGGYDHTIKTWNAKTGVNLRTFQFQNSITPDRQLIAAAGYQQIFMYELASKNPCPTISYDGIVKNITGLGFQEDGKWMYTGGEDMTARIWDMRGRSVQCQRIFQVNSPVTCVRLHPNQCELIVGDLGGVIHLWDLKTDHNEQLIPEEQASIIDVAVSADGTSMAAVNNRGRCYIWSLTLGNETTKFTPLHKFEAHSRYCLKCKFSPDGRFLVTTSADQTARVWCTDDYTLIKELHVEGQRWVWGADFTLDSQSLVTASSDGVARLWDIATTTVIRDYSGHQKALTALAFKDSAI